MMLHYPDHATKAFSIPGCEKLVLPMVLNMLLFWTEVQVLNFQYRKGIIPFELHSHWEHHFSMSYSPLKVPAEQLGVLWLEGQNRVG